MKAANKQKWRWKGRGGKKALAYLLIAGMIFSNVPFKNTYASEQDAYRVTEEIQKIGGEKNKIAYLLDGTATYDFQDGVFLESQVDLGGKTSEDGYLSVYPSSKGMPVHSGGHGIEVTTDDQFEVHIGKGKATIHFSACKYGSSTITMSVDGREIEKRDISEVVEDKEDVIFSYIAQEDTTITFTISGNGYLHGITLVQEKWKPSAVVSGSVTEELNGSMLSFFKEKESVPTATTTVKDGTYEVVLPIGTKYRVKIDEKQGKGYQVPKDFQIDLTSFQEGDHVQVNLELLNQDATKSNFLTATKSGFLTIGGTKFVLTPGNTESEAFTVEAIGGTGSVELCTADSAIIWADLEGGGKGILTDTVISDVSDAITVSHTDHTIEIQYQDDTSTPLLFTLFVKDNSASGIPKKDGKLISYDMKDGSVLSTSYKDYPLKNGNSVLSTDKLVKLTGKNEIKYNGSSHGIALKDGDTIEVKVAGDAAITFDTCYYSAASSLLKVSAADGAGTVLPEQQGFQDASTNCENTITYSYTGDATTLTFFVSASGSCYLHGLTVMNEAEQTTENPQEYMPSVLEGFQIDENAPSTGTVGKMSVTAVGQTLVATQTGGKMQTLKSPTTAIDPSVGYYVFPQTTQNYTLTADVVLENCGSSTSNGIFFGGFDGTYLATIAIRNGTGLRGIYSKSASDYTGAGGTNASITKGEKVSFTVQKKADGLHVSYITESKEQGSTIFKYNSNSYLLLKEQGKDSSLFYGFALANATASISNLKMIDEQGNVIYDQNAVYNPIGTAPVVSAVEAIADESREFITVSWKGEECTGDGKYVLQVSRDGKQYVDVADNLTKKTYSYPIKDAGSYYFRVCGTLGNQAAEDKRNAYVELSAPVKVIAALQAPNVKAVASKDSVSVSWNRIEDAERYEVYRYSFDETQENKQCITSTADLSYIDEAVVAEMPYYYYVIAYSSDNNSNPSNTVWALPTAGHNGEYVYEEEAAEIFITKKSYDTVYSDTIVLEGVVDKKGMLTAKVNDVQQGDEISLEANGNFHFTLQLEEGRNDVTLYFTDEEKKVTRKTFSYVYLTHYDKVVDASFEGVDGDLIDGVEYYKTVQKAVDSVSSSNSKNIVILIKEGSYKERLVVTSPYITLIGEDREMVKIHCYPGDYKEEGAAGGNMAERCAIYIQKTAQHFHAENLTFENDYVYLGDGSKSNESADALRNDADNASYVNVRILGYQDTLCANGGKQYYEKCYISGNVDFIYGNEPRAFFKDCAIVFRFNANKNSGYVCAPKTAKDATYGLTFYDCQILSEENCSGNNYRLARPWGEDAYITWISCYMGKIINRANPYADMSGNAHQNARFFEYSTYGPGFLVNEMRRQISPSKSESMITPEYLEWNPEAIVEEIGKTDYIGSIITNSEPKYVIYEYQSDSYLPTDGDDTGFGRFDLEGYAAASKVTGGGLLIEGVDGYYQVGTAEQFLEALTKVKKTGKKSVIELTKDIGLGCKEVKNFSSYSSVIKAYTNQALTHPTLIESGTSVLMLKDMANITIFSKNGAKILHTNIDITNSSNIIIRNITFDELWEWDEETEGAYDRNDWDYMTIEAGSTDIWIDHCTFYKSYDGVIDVKNPADGLTADITISWCEFLPGSSSDFFDTMINLIESDIDSYPYYRHLREELGMTKEQVYTYAYGQKKTHLFGQSDEATNAEGIRVTLANNYYKDTMDRLPRLRYGKSHVYNCIMDAQTLYKAKMSISNIEAAQKLVSNGASSTCGAEILLENCFIQDIINALNSGNGSSPAGYINAVNSLYYMDGKQAVLEPKSNSSADDRVLITDERAFKKALPYSDYVLFDADDLDVIVQPYAGAKKLEFTTLQWEKTSYYDPTWDGGVDVEEPTTPEESTPEEGENPSTPEESTPEEGESPSTPEESTPEEGESPSTPEEGESPSIPEESTPEEGESPSTSEEETTSSSWADNTDDEEETKKEDIVLNNTEQGHIQNALGTHITIHNVVQTENGKLVSTTQNQVVFLGKDGILLKKEWQQVNGIWYYFGVDYKAQSGWMQMDNELWYYFDPNNKKMQTGWQQIEDGKWYLLDPTSGEMKTGWQQIEDGKWYLLDPTSGEMKTGWQQTEDEKWYLLDPTSGEMKTGWQQIEDGKWYLLDPTSGEMKTGWQQTEDGKWYLLDPITGEMQTGWKQMESGKWYYLGEDGSMLANTNTPDGYSVDPTGAWIFS